MHLAISGRGKLKHITTDPPATKDSSFRKWAQNDSIVISWIVENIDAELVNQYLDYPKARDLWKGIESMYSSGRDRLQIFDLTVKANKIQQCQEPIEHYYSKLLSIWKEIDRHMPNFDI